MGENVRVLGQISHKEMKTVDVPDDRTGADTRRAEVRSVLVRLLVKLYTDRHKDQLKEAA